jgi:hypothetical protein
MTDERTLDRVIAHLRTHVAELGLLVRTVSPGANEGSLGPAFRGSG